MALPGHDHTAHPCLHPTSLPHLVPLCCWQVSPAENENSQWLNVIIRSHLRLPIYVPSDTWGDSTQNTEQQKYPRGGGDKAMAETPAAPPVPWILRVFRTEVGCRARVTSRVFPASSQQHLSPPFSLSLLSPSLIKPLPSGNTSVNRKPGPRGAGSFVGHSTHSSVSSFLLPSLYLSDFSANLCRILTFSTIHP